jgi:hypothetical protein
MTFFGLPEHLRTDPHLISHRVDLLEIDVQALKEHASKPEHQPQMVDTPLGKLPLPLVLIIGLWLMARYPDHVLKALGL